MMDSLLKKEIRIAPDASFARIFHKPECCHLPTGVSALPAHSAIAKTARVDFNITVNEVGFEICRLMEGRLAQDLEGTCRCVAVSPGQLCS